MPVERGYNYTVQTTDERGWARRLSGRGRTTLKSPTDLSGLNLAQELQMALRARIVGNPNNWDEALIDVDLKVPGTYYQVAVKDNQVYVTKKSPSDAYDYS